MGIGRADSQDCFLIICEHCPGRGLRKLGASHILGYLVALFLSRVCGMELSGVSWTWQGVGRTEDKVKFRKKNFRTRELRRVYLNLFKVDSLIWLPGTHKNFEFVKT